MPTANGMAATAVLVAMALLALLRATPTAAAAAAAPLGEEGADPDTCFIHKETTKMFYNRIPKAASTSLKTLAGMLAKRNGHRHLSSRVYNDRGWFEEAEELKNVARITGALNKYPKVLYDQHIRYLNFTKFGFPQPVYINMVREPVSRAVSTYYFARTGDHSRRDEIRAFLGPQADWSVDECLEKSEECEWFKEKADHFNLMTRFFCGHHPDCASVTEAALAIAKENIRAHFQIVGVTERFTESVMLLERVFPTYFEGATTLVDGHDNHSKANVNSKAGPSPSPENKLRLQEMARFDTELYRFAVDIFDRRLKACGIKL